MSPDLSGGYRCDCASSGSKTRPTKYQRLKIYILSKTEQVNGHIMEELACSRGLRMKSVFLPNS